MARLLGFRCASAARGCQAEPEVVALYVADLRRRGRRPAAISRKLAAIAVNTVQPPPKPCKHDVVRVEPPGSASLSVRARLSSSIFLTRVLGHIVMDPRGVRDCALLLLGWAAALRRSELVAINFEDRRFEEEGLVVRIRRSKTDQESAGDKVAIVKGSEAKTCPVTSVRRWLEMSGITLGPVFRRVRRGGAVGSVSLAGYAVA